MESLFSFNRVPDFLHFGFKRPKVGFNFDLVFAFEGFWYSPRVPAGAASAILEFSGGKNIAFLVNDFQFRGANVAIIFLYARTIFFAGLADD